MNLSWQTSYRFLPYLDQFSFFHITCKEVIILKCRKKGLSNLLGGHCASLPPKKEFRKELLYPCYIGHLESIKYSN